MSFRRPSSGWAGSDDVVCCADVVHRGEVAEHHDVFSVPSVDDGACDGACDDLGDCGEEGDEGEGGGFSGCLPRPYGDGELGHAGAEEGDELAEPDDGEAPHAGGAPGLGFLGCAVVSGFGGVILMD